MTLTDWQASLVAAFGALFPLSTGGFFVPKPSSQVGSHVLSAGWPAETVHGCPWESADEKVGQPQ